MQCICQLAQLIVGWGGGQRLRSERVWKCFSLSCLQIGPDLSVEFGVKPIMSLIERLATAYGQLLFASPVVLLHGTAAQKAGFNAALETVRILATTVTRMHFFLGPGSEQLAHKMLVCARLSA